VIVLSLIWSVVLADEKIEEAEKRFLLQMRSRFQIQEKDELKAKEIALNRRV
jgi:uncharacterized tellurite resistance protein B-like protein